MLTASTYWIGLSILAMLGCLFLLWLSYRLFAQASAEDSADARIKTALKEMAKLESRLASSGYASTADKKIMDCIIEDAEMESSINGTRWNNVKRRFKIIEERLDALEKAVNNKDQNK